MNNKFPQLIKIRDKYHFVALDETVSEDGFYDASNYTDGFAPVQQFVNGPYFYRDILGNLGKRGFYFAVNYSQGYGVVKLTENSKFYFVDTDGNLSNDGYDYTSIYHKGFVRVQNGRQCFYRDLLGNITKSKTYFGKLINEYYEGRIKLEELLNVKDLPYDKKFRNFVIRNERHKLRQRFFVMELENCQDENDKNEIITRSKIVSDLLDAYEQNLVNKCKADKISLIDSESNDDANLNCKEVEKGAEQLHQENPERNRAEKDLDDAFDKMLRDYLERI